MKSSLKNVNLKIDWASYQAAEYACKHWYYNPTIPRAGLVKIGAWEDGKLVGVLIFSKGANNNLGKPYGLTHTECCELTRLAFTSHKSPMTRILRIAINNFLLKKCPNIRLIITYSDKEYHHGGIYQAANWYFLGETGGDDDYIYRGRRYHGRAFRSTFGHIGKYRDEIEIVKSGSKYRYALPLDEEMKELIMSMAKSYPKRAIGVNGNTSAIQAEDSGSTPTIALLSSNAQSIIETFAIPPQLIGAISDNPVTNEKDQ